MELPLEKSLRGNRHTLSWRRHSIIATTRSVIMSFKKTSDRRRTARSHDRSQPGGYNNGMGTLSDIRNSFSPCLHGNTVIFRQRIKYRRTQTRLRHSHRSDTHIAHRRDQKYKLRPDIRIAFTRHRIMEIFSRHTAFTQA